MAWYRSGTISLTNGSAAVTGAGTAWILNASVGEALLAPDGKLYEISAITSDTSITLATAYLGATQAGQAYVLVPTQSYIRDLAAQAAALVNTYSSIANNAGAGKFGDGTVAAPGVAFAGDQDTGFLRSANNEVTFVANGVAQFKYSATGGVQFLSTSVDINGGTIDGTVIGGAAPAAGNFTTLSASGQIYSAANIAAVGEVTGLTVRASIASLITDWNAVVTTGDFMAFEGANAPTPYGWYIGRATAHNTGYVTQEAWLFTADKPVRFRRHLREEGWSAWVHTGEWSSSGLTVAGVVTAKGATSIDANTAFESNAPASGLTAYHAQNNGGYGAFFGYDNLRYSGGAAMVRNIANTPLVFETNNTECGRFDQNGNMGLGAVPAPHAPSGFGGPMLQVGGRAGLMGNNGYCTLANNAYYNAGYYRYIANGAANLYEQGNGANAWYSASAGTAGDPISFTQAMKLDAAGHLGLGVTPSGWGANYKAIDIGTSGSLVSNTGVSTFMLNNCYHSGANWVYRTGAVGVGAQLFGGNPSGTGGFAWSQAPAGNAGDPISFTQAMTLDASGNLLVGVTSGGWHTIARNVAHNDSNPILQLTTLANTSALFYAVSGSFGNSANAAVKLGNDAQTGRSINAGGTINASGADYAEYERNNGLVIGKGSVVGFKADGTLTLTYAEAIRFGIKSTNPSYVGGDVWGSEDQVGKRPDQPSYTAPTYTGPQSPVEPVKPAIQEGEEVNAEADDAAYLEALNAYQEQLTAYFDAQAAHKAAVEAAEAAHAEAMAQYEADKAAFDARLEAARQTVDRIAYSGKVPVNVQGATPGDYIIAAPTLDGGIHGWVVSKADMTFAKYQDAVGRVNRILEDGRCEVAVIVH